jgi:alpha-ribazole phosphatase
MLITLVRHGETEAAGQLLGRTDVPLSSMGWEQFERQTQTAVFDVVVTSPSQRARLPAERLAAGRQLPLRVDEDWAELDFGDWDGASLADLHADPAAADALAELYRSADAPGAPGGESWRALEMRAARAIDRLFALGADSRVLVATHAGPMRATLAVALAMPFANLWSIRIDYGTRITLRVERGADAGLWGEIIEVAQP